MGFLPTRSLRVRFEVEDEALSRLHSRAFGSPLNSVQPWSARLARHSLTWVGAFVAEELVGFVHACWDGGAHAFVLDAVVDPEHQGQGIGRQLVATLVAEVTTAGCEWLHVDYEPHLHAFYRDACGFQPTQAGLLRLGPASSGGLA
ncbi:MAG TPA: GNAT family N-acetyltransferase [Propionibacteriaceae bacterium]|nr:GNAT family N-acetyltransferase [Propionibacteriaceae bacterium]